MRDEAAYILYYDADCSFCTRTVHLLEKLDRRRRVSWLPFQSLSEPLEGLTWADFEREAYLESKGRLEGGFYAFRRLTLILPALWFLAPLMWLPGMQLPGNAAYRWIARNRGRLTAAGCETDAPSEHQ